MAVSIHWVVLFVGVLLIRALLVGDLHISGHLVFGNSRTSRSRVTSTKNTFRRTASWVIGPTNIFIFRIVTGGSRSSPNLEKAPTTIQTLHDATCTILSIVPRVLAYKLVQEIRSKIIKHEPSAWTPKVKPYIPM